MIFPSFMDKRSGFSTNTYRILGKVARNKADKGGQDIDYKLM